VLECAGVGVESTKAAGTLGLQLKRPPPVIGHGNTGGREPA
jgi:hypothetical protein